MDRGCNILISAASHYLRIGMKRIFSVHLGRSRHCYFKHHTTLPTKFALSLTQNHHNLQSVLATRVFSSVEPLVSCEILLAPVLRSPTLPVYNVFQSLIPISSLQQGLDPVFETLSSHVGSSRSHSLHNWSSTENPHQWLSTPAMTSPPHLGNLQTVAPKPICNVRRVTQTAHSNGGAPT